MLRMMLVVWMVGVPAQAVTDTACFALRDGDVKAVAEALETLAWEPGAFDVDAQPGDGDADAILSFPTARPAGDAAMDTVRLRWFAPRGADAADDADAGPAVLLIHSLHPDMPIGLGLARGLRAKGIHAFLLELPGYGARVPTPAKMTGVTPLEESRMAVADVRRAYDVIASRAGVDPSRVVLQGTSLGSYFAAAAAGLDDCFATTILLLSGGNGVDILENGQKDAYHVRGALRHYGYDTHAKLTALIDPVEPLRLAPRLDPATTWMVNAKDDTVVPADNAQALAAAIGLDEDHHLWMPGNHYTSFILLPGVLDLMARQTLALPAGQADTEARP